jgi:hypothetical protein
MSWLGRLTAKLGFLGGAAAEPAGGQSRKIARERLSIILAHQRGANLLSEGQMQRLQEEVLESVKVSLVLEPLLSQPALSCCLVTELPPLVSPLEIEIYRRGCFETCQHDSEGRGEHRFYRDAGRSPTRGRKENVKVIMC